VLFFVPVLDICHVIRYEISPIVCFVFCMAKFWIMAREKKHDKRNEVSFPQNYFQIRLESFYAHFGPQTTQDPPRAGLWPASDQAAGLRR